MSWWSLLDSPDWCAIIRGGLGDSHDFGSALEFKLL